MKKYNVVIIGAGSIGAMKPDELDAPNMEFPLTHAAAVIKLNTYFNLETIIDSNFETAIKASQKWHCGAAGGIEFLPNGVTNNTDVIVIATNTENHLEAFKHVARVFKNLKIIILEKPAGMYSFECAEIRDIAEKNNIKIVVNYTRRFEPYHKLIADNIISGKYGKIYSARFHYTRGLKRDGCHAIDLANWFFGHCRSIEKHSGFAIDDYNSIDLTVPLIAEYDWCPMVTFNPCDGRKYSIFELELLTERGKISIHESGQKIMRIVPMTDGVYGNYKSLKYGLNIIETETKLKECLMNLYKEVYNYLTIGEEVSCDINDAMKVHKVIEHITNKRRL